MEILCSRNARNKYVVHFYWEPIYVFLFSILFALAYLEIYNFLMHKQIFILWFSMSLV